jgi:hypothetical protein
MTNIFSTFWPYRDHTILHWFQIDFYKDLRKISPLTKQRRRTQYVDVGCISHYLRKMFLLTTRENRVQA